MPRLALHRCFHHEDREAVCRCPNCARYFCRECVAPHDGRLLCSPCVLNLAAAASDTEAVRRVPRGIGQVFLAVLTLLMVWLIFFLAGWTLIQLRPTAPVAGLRATPLGVEARAV